MHFTSGEAGSMTVWESCRETMEPDQSRKTVQGKDCDSIYSVLLLAVEI